MSCPFAKFASMLPPLNATKLADLDPHPHHATPPSRPSTSAPRTLSEALRTGTSASHRAVERSLGVSLLLSSSPSTAVHFSRLDYVRFQLMLLCIYVVLEGALVRERVGLGPMFQAALMDELARSGAVWEDVQSHLDVLDQVAGAKLEDLVEQARDEFGQQHDALSNLIHTVQQALPHAATLSNTHIALTSDHLALLTPIQISSTLAYVSRLSTASPPQLLAHAYTRYLGDLSGGQHIVRKVSKRFPCPTDKGFQFYHFTGTDLKQRFRNAMESCTVPDTDAVVREANIAFDLNTALFESLLPEELRMQVADHVPAVRVKQDKWKPESLVVGLLVAVSLVYVFNLVASGKQAVELHI